LSEKVKLGKFSSEPENFSEIGGNLKQGEECIIASEGWMPLPIHDEEKDHGDGKNGVRGRREKAGSGVISKVYLGAEPS